MCVCLQMMLKTFKIGACVVSSQIPSVSYIPYLKNTLLVVFPDHTLFTVDGPVNKILTLCILLDSSIWFDTINLGQFMVKACNFKTMKYFCHIRLLLFFFSS